MPDITMCDNNLCKSKDACYRYTAEPKEYNQSYFIGNSEEMDKCESYWEVEGTILGLPVFS